MTKVYHKKTPCRSSVFMFFYLIVVFLLDRSALRCDAAGVLLSVDANLYCSGDTSYQIRHSLHIALIHLGEIRGVPHGIVYNGQVGGLGITL